MMTFFLIPRTIALRFFLVVLLLTAANLVALYFYFFQAGYGDLGEYFDVGLESNIPTLYSALAIFVSSVLLWLHGLESRRSGDGQHRYWFGLSAIMAYLGMDEAVTIHELASNLMEHFMVAEGYLYFLWVVPYGFATIVIGLLYIRFLRRLPQLTARLFVAAGAIYLAGALGVELLGAGAGDLYGTGSLLYSLLYSIEEFLEMSGIVVFIYALLLHGTEGCKGWTIRITLDTSGS